MFPVAVAFIIAVLSNLIVQWVNGLFENTIVVTNVHGKN